MKPSQSQTPHAINIRIKSRNKARILVAEAKPASVSLTPNPKSAIDQQRRVEEAAGDADLNHLGGGGMGVEAAGDGGEAEIGREEEGGESGGVETDLFDAAAQLARAASAPGEELYGRGRIGWGLPEKRHS